MLARKAHSRSVFLTNQASAFSWSSLKFQTMLEQASIGSLVLWSIKNSSYSCSARFKLIWDRLVFDQAKFEHTLKTRSVFNPNLTNQPLSRLVRLIYHPYTHELYLEKFLVKFLGGFLPKMSNLYIILTKLSLLMQVRWTLTPTNLTKKHS